MGRAQEFRTRRSGVIEIQETNSTHVGVETSQKRDFSVVISQKTFTGELQLLSMSTALWGQRQRMLDPTEIRDCQRYPGELRWLAPASRPDGCAR